MRLMLSINGKAQYTASVGGSGYLNANLNLRNWPKDNDFSRDVRVAGAETAETETVWMKWPSQGLNVGDVVELTVLPDDGPNDLPAEIRRSSEDPNNLFSNAEFAKEVFDTVRDFDSQLMRLLSKSEHIEPPEEHHKVKRAIGAALYDLGKDLLYPIFRRHKDLIPEELKGELL